MKAFARPGFAMITIWSGLMMSFTTGCASGGFKLTREYAGWVNKQNIVIRIILYLLTSIVFAVTLLIDLVINNTMDFWEGRVSQGTYQFESEGRTYVAVHSKDEQGLKSSVITISGRDLAKPQVVDLRETKNGKIELRVDGVLRTQVENIYESAEVLNFDSKGKLTSRAPLEVAQRVSKL